MSYSRTDRCPECGRLENHKHVFYDCLNAAAMWRKVAGLYGLPRVTYDTVRFLDPMPVPQRKAPGFGLLVLEVVFQLWTARNKAITEKTRPRFASLCLRHETPYLQESQRTWRRSARANSGRDGGSTTTSLLLRAPGMSE
ncbi:unnamed protein product [Ixodes hexagonus]